MNQGSISDQSIIDPDDDADWDDSEIDNTYLTFRLAGSEYAVAVSHVKEIVRLPECIAVPDVPAFIRGVINLRGQVIPLMDARSRLGLPEVEYSDRTIVIVLEADEVSTGLVADGVNGVTEFPPGSVSEETNGAGRTSNSRAIKGISQVDGAVSIVLDAARLLGGDLDPQSTTSSTA